MKDDLEKGLHLTTWQFQLMMLLCILVWALAFPFIKIALNDLSFINLTIMRFLVVCIIFLTILALQPKRFSKLQKKDIFPIFLLGFAGVIIYHLGLNYGEQYISAGAASLIIATIPIFIVLFAFVLLKERLSRVQFIGVLLALLGVLIISIWGKEDSSLEIQYLSGALAVVIASVMGAVYTIVGKKLLTRYSALSLTVYAMILGSIGLLPFVSGSLLQEVAAMTLDSWIAVLFLGAFSTVIGYMIWYIALKIKTASELSIYLYAIPVVSTIVSYFFLGEGITFWYLIGGAFVFLGLYSVNMKN